MLRFIVLAAVALLPLAAGATGNFTDCRDPLTVSAGATSGQQNISRGSRVCYQFDDTTDSAVFFVSGITALVCFDPDAAGTVGAARVEVEACPYSAPGTVGNQCINIVDAPLTGTAGASATQNACVRVARGLYRIDVTTAPASGAEKAIVTILGEE